MLSGQKTFGKDKKKIIKKILMKIKFNFDPSKVHN